MSHVIHHGKHAGKTVAELKDSTLKAMYGSWSDHAILKDHPLTAEMLAEIKRRELATKAMRQAKRESSKSKPRLTGRVEAKCSGCGQLSTVSAEAWKVPEGARKPWCRSCGEPIYLADQSLVVSYMGCTTHEPIPESEWVS